jgi:hypothetical protein
LSGNKLCRCARRFPARRISAWIAAQRFRIKRAFNATHVYPQLKGEDIMNSSKPPLKPTQDAQDPALSEVELEQIAAAGASSLQDFSDADLIERGIEARSNYIDAQNAFNNNLPGSAAAARKWNAEYDQISSELKARGLTIPN